VEISFARCLLYASILSLVESAILSLPLALWDGISNIDEARVVAVFLGAITLVSLLVKSPSLAGTLVLARRWLQPESRSRLSLLNTGVYVFLILAVLVPAVFVDPSVELPPGFYLYGLACLVSPQIPWIRLPVHSTQQTDSNSTQDTNSSTVLIKAVALIGLGLVVLFSLMTSVCAPAA